MKHTNIFSFVMLMAAAVLSSCNKLENNQDATASAPLVDSGFYAQMAAADDSKTTLEISSGKVLWETNDPIMVSNGTSTSEMYIKQGGSTGSSLYTSGAILSGNAFYAVYPSTGGSYASGVFHSTIPTNQSYVAGGFASQVFPMVAACGADRIFSFKNAASLFKIVPTSTDLSAANITGLSISADQKLAGAISVNYAQGGTPTVSCSGSNTVNMTCPSPVAMGTPIYVVVAPGAYTNVSIMFSLSNGMKIVHNAGSVNVERSKYQTISASLTAASYTDLSASGTANCYIIKKAGSYKFKANVKGNGVVTSAGLPSATGGISGVKVYYTDGDNFLSGSLSYMDGYVYFTTVSGTLPIGTALVSVTDANGATLWSWHLWANRNVADVKLSNNQTWLNMNLGAHQVAFNAEGYNGYYYQWGRKDPFQQAVGVNNVMDAPFVSHASQTDGSLANSIKYPLYYYGSYKTADNVSIADWCTFDDNVKYYDWWNKNMTADDQKTATPAKTMFDPCPPGYRVPSFPEVEALSNLAGDAEDAAGTSVVVDGKLSFPYISSRGAGITKKYWGGVQESADGLEGERGFYHCNTPQSTGGKSSRLVYRFYVRKGGLGCSGSTTPRATGMVVRCIKG
jgi:hypothetical protein